MFHLLLTFLFSVFLCFNNSLTKDSYLFPAVQVLASLAEKKWKNSEIRAELLAVSRKIWSESLLLGEELVREYSDSLISFLRTTFVGSIRQQLEAIVENILEKDDLKLPGTKAALKKFLNNLKDSKKELYKELKKIPPLIYN